MEPKQMVPYNNHSNLMGPERSPNDGEARTSPCGKRCSPPRPSLSDGEDDDDASSSDAPEPTPPEEVETGREEEASAGGRCRDRGRGRAKAQWHEGKRLLVEVSWTMSPLFVREAGTLMDGGRDVSWDVRGPTRKMMGGI
ncbi:hypothetical protein MMC14_007348 [Varicellaria rhodocarpa]|nr:hypothetical protein [Varicellaria rhodocarpa]